MSYAGSPPPPLALRTQPASALQAARVGASPNLDWGDKALARTWKSVGTLCFAIGIVNAFIPLLPTTVFLLLGVWAYGKGDPLMRERMLQHPKFGPSLRRWVEHRQISRVGKLGACLGIAGSAAGTAFLIGNKPIMWAIVLGLGVLCAWLATRDEPAAV
jgi:uncharacterized membrane protein YbaN (DUF454 family)